MVLRALKNGIVTGLAGIVLATNVFSDSSQAKLDPINYHSQISEENIIVNPTNPIKYIINIKLRHPIDPYTWGIFKNKEELDTLLADPLKARRVKEYANHRVDKVYQSQLVVKDFLEELYDNGNTNLLTEGLFGPTTKEKIKRSADSYLDFLVKTELLTAEELQNKKLVVGTPKVHYLEGKCNMVPCEIKTHFLEHRNAGNKFGFKHPLTLYFAEIRENDILNAAINSEEDYPTVTLGFNHDLKNNVLQYNANNLSNQLGLIVIDANVNISNNADK